MRPYGGVTKCESKGHGSKKCRICACTAGLKCELGEPVAHGGD